MHDLNNVQVQQQIATHSLEMFCGLQKNKNGRDIGGITDRFDRH